MIDPAKEEEGKKKEHNVKPVGKKANLIYGKLSSTPLVGEREKIKEKKDKEQRIDANPAPLRGCHPSTISAKGRTYSMLSKAAFTV